MFVKDQAGYVWACIAKASYQVDTKKGRVILSEHGECLSCFDVYGTGDKILSYTKIGDSFKINGIHKNPLHKKYLSGLRDGWRVGITGGVFLVTMDRVEKEVQGK